MAQMKAYIMPMKKITLICNLVHLPKEFQNWVVCGIYKGGSNLGMVGGGHTGQCRSNYGIPHLLREKMSLGFVRHR